MRESVRADALHTVSEILMLYPTDTVKTRAQLATGKNVGMLQTFREIIRNEGVARLYRGITLPILMEASCLRFSPRPLSP